MTPMTPTPHTRFSDVELQLFVQKIDLFLEEDKKWKLQVREELDSLLKKEANIAGVSKFLFYAGAVIAGTVTFIFLILDKIKIGLK